MRAHVSLAWPSQCSESYAYAALSRRNWLPIQLGVICCAEYLVPHLVACKTFKQNSLRLVL